MKKKNKYKKQDLDQKKSRIFAELERLYQKMEMAYNEIASRLGLKCSECEDNCCVSYFQHHTHIEWAYFFKGLKTLSQDRQKQIISRAKEYVDLSKKELEKGIRPKIMCPVNENGLCILYKYRLMICRLHGIPNTVKMPNGITKKFPGCSMCIVLTKNSPYFPMMDRTPFYQALADLERRFTKLLKNPIPKVDYTLAQMILLGAPK